MKRMLLVSMLVAGAAVSTESQAMLRMATRSVLPHVGRVAMQARAASSKVDGAFVKKVYEDWKEKVAQDPSLNVFVVAPAYPLTSYSGAEPCKHDIPSTEVSLAIVKDALEHNEHKLSSERNFATFAGTATFATLATTLTHFINQGCSLSMASAATLTLGAMGTGMFGLLCHDGLDEAGHTKSYVNANKDSINHFMTIRKQLEQKRAEVKAAQKSDTK